MTETGPGWILHLGDARTRLLSLPDRSVDHVLTDPPYTDHVHAKQRTDVSETSHALDFASLDAATMTACAAQFARVARRWVVVFCAAEQIGEWRAALTGAGLECVRVGAWVKPDAMPQLTGDRPSVGFEPLVIAHRPGRKVWNGGGRTAVWTCPKNEATRVHPTQKPLGLMEALCRDFTDAGETILDPFAGSGTTGVAALRLGREFIGVERDPTYHAAALKRLRNAREQLRFFEGTGT